MQCENSNCQIQVGQNVQETNYGFCKVPHYFSFIQIRSNKKYMSLIAMPRHDIQCVEITMGGKPAIYSGWTSHWTFQPFWYRKRSFDCIRSFCNCGCAELWCFVFLYVCQFLWELWTLEATFTAIRTLVSAGLIQNKRFGHVPFKHDQVNNIKYQCIYLYRMCVR